MIELSDIRVISLFGLLICHKNVMSLFSKSHKRCIHKWTSNKAESAGVQLNWRTEKLNLDPCVAFCSTVEQLVNSSQKRNSLFCIIFFFVSQIPKAALWMLSCIVFKVAVGVISMPLVVTTRIAIITTSLSLTCWKQQLHKTDCQVRCKVFNHFDDLQTLKICTIIF